MSGPPPAGELSQQEVLRYSRHLMIPEVGLEGQQRLKAARVLVVGAGGLGSPVALYLAAAGVGRLGIVDYDVVDATNLHRQILHDTDTVGQPKLESAGRRLRALNPEVEIVEIEARLDSSNAMEVFAGWDLVVDGSDNFPTRYLVNDAAVLSGIPLVYGAIFRFDGQASVFATPGGPCYRCLFRDPPPPGLIPSCADAGVLGVLPGIVGSVQATEAIKLILGQGTTLAGRLLLIEALHMEFRELRIRRDPECPVCGDRPTVTELIDYELFCGEGAGSAVEPEATPGPSRTGYAGAAEPAPAARPPTPGAVPIPRVPEIDVHELKSRVDGGERFQLVDVRKPYEWLVCNLSEQGARLIPLDELSGRLDELEQDEELIVMCRSGARSARVTAFLREQGFANAVNLRGGILAWARQIVAWARQIDPEVPIY
jgi:adenylyltransferase/sulfurtransferase